MTHKDIYTKFMIEYDKANVTSSYPSLTEYEVATLLDKAYNALIAQKFTGNNLRRLPFEGDTKVITDLEPLIAHADLVLFNNNHTPAINVIQYRLPSDCLYYVQSYFNYVPKGKPMDKLNSRLVPTKLVTHEIASKFMATSYNIPWVKNPVSYIENDIVYTVYDELNKPIVDPTKTAHLTYIRKPNSFVECLITVSDEPNTPITPDNPNNPDNPDNPDTPTIKIKAFTLAISYLGGPDLLGYIEQENNQGNQSGTTTPDTQNPTDEQKDVYSIADIKIKNVVDNQYYYSNTDAYSQTGVSFIEYDATKNGNPTDVVCTVLSGSQYVQVIPTSVPSTTASIKILPAASTKKTVKLRLSSKEDSTVYKDIEIQVLYNVKSEEQTAPTVQSVEVTKMFTFKFNQPENLIPSITRAAAEGSSRNITDETFFSTDGKVRMSFGYTEARPEVVLPTEIVTYIQHSPMEPALAVHRFGTIVIEAVDSKIKSLRIPAGYLVGGLGIDKTYPTNIATNEYTRSLALDDDSRYYIWNSPNTDNITKIVLVNGSNVATRIGQFGIEYTTTESSSSSSQSYNQRTVTFNFDNPESLSPSITRSSDTGGGLVDITNETFASSDNNITINFDNSNVSDGYPIYIQNVSDVCNLRLTTESKLIIQSADNVKIKRVRFPGSDIMSGVDITRINSSNVDISLQLNSDQSYYYWKSDNSQSVSSLTFTSKAPWYTKIHKLLVDYETPYGSSIVQESNEQEQYAPGDIPEIMEVEGPVTNVFYLGHKETGMTYDFQKKYNLYYQEPGGGIINDAALMNNGFKLWVSGNNRLYTSDKYVYLVNFWDNYEVARGKLVYSQEDVGVSDNGFPRIDTVVFVPDKPIQSGSLKNGTYSLVIFNGTIGDAKFDEYMRDPVKYIQSGKSKADCHANAYTYFMVELDSSYVPEQA